MSADGRKIHTAILGFGAVVKAELLPALRACGRFEIVAVAEPRNEEKEIGALPGPLPRRVEDYREIDPAAIDLVIVALPHHLHAEASCEFLSRGVHVFCEKPMAVSVNECLRMLEAASASGSVLMVGHVMRFAAPVLVLKRLLACGFLGAPRYFSCKQGTTKRHFGDSGFYRRRRYAGGGVVLDKGVHVLDLVEYLCGPLTIRGTHLIEAGDGDLEDEVNIEITLEGSEHPSFYTLSRVRNLDNVLSLVCEEGNAHLDLRNLHRLRLSCPLVSGSDSMRVSFHPSNPFEAELRHLADVIEKGAPCLSSGEAGLRVLGHVETIYRQLAAGERGPF